MTVIFYQSPLNCSPVLLGCLLFCLIKRWQRAWTRRGKESRSPCPTPTSVARIPFMPLATWAASLSSGIWSRTSTWTSTSLTLCEVTHRNSCLSIYFHICDRCLISPNLNCIGHVLMLLGYTPAEHAVSYGRLPVLRFLLDHGADLHQM
jgi:hypothetical protein